MKTLTILILSISIFGCASSMTVRIESEPPGGIIEVNGVKRGITPGDVEFRKVKTLGGPEIISCTAVSVITVYPPTSYPSTLYSQTKKLIPCYAPDGSIIFFDLRLESINPTQPIHIK